MKLLIRNGKVVRTNSGNAAAIKKPLPPIQIQIDSKVPQDLSVFPQVTVGQIYDSTEREKGKIYIDIDGTPSYLTLQQIKELNTRTICVDALTDTRVATLGAGDFVLLRKE